MTFADSVAKAVLYVTKEWAAIKKKQERNQRQAERMVERLCRDRGDRVTAKQAAYQVIPEAYAKASGGGQYPANARQVMYAARPAIQDLTGQALNDTYFTQVLLPDFMREHASETADWDVVYDARGHLWEPHTSREISLGTLGVREYLSEMRADRSISPGLTAPYIDIRFPTCGPRHRYGAILYIEKEGFIPLLQQARFAERHDLAIMSSKGMGTTAVRTLIESLFEDVRILVLHDFDKSGFSIIGTLTRDTRRYTYTTEPQVVDLGLRLTDVQRWGLQAEDVVHTADPAPNLELNGATPDEIEFLQGEPAHGYKGERYKGRRVELNAFTSEQFVVWLESKLAEHGVRKVIPNATTLEQAYRRAAGLRRYQAVIAAALQDVDEYSRTLPVPDNLEASIEEQLSRDASASWDEAIDALVRRSPYRE